MFCIYHSLYICCLSSRHIFLRSSIEALAGLLAGSAHGAYLSELIAQLLKDGR